MSQNWLLTHCDRVMHIGISKLTTICPDDGLSRGQYQAIIWTNAVILFIPTLRTNFSEINKQNLYIFIQEKAIWKCHLQNGSIFCSALICL